MMIRSMFKRLVVATVAIVALAAPGYSALLFDYGAVWKYKIGTEEASNPDPAAWRAVGFDDSSWLSGRAPIGYATPPSNPAEENLATILPSSQQANYLSVFLRKWFAVRTPSEIGELTLNLNVDDGCVVWINGIEIARFNAPAGGLAFNANASAAIEPTLNSVTLTNNLSQLLLSGDNVLAIQLLNANLTSSDILMDGALNIDLDESPPRLIEIVPEPQSSVSELIHLEVVFDENVSGVDAADLLISGVAATNVAQVSPRNYVFNFPQPPAGAVEVAWAANHGIADWAGTPNPFGGGQWSYTLDLIQPAPRVVISEFMADNDHGIRDQDGNRSDWIELFNPGPLAVDLNGWFLTDTTNVLAMWRMPAVVLDANRYLLVWASGKNRGDPGAPLHTNFKLDSGGSYLALADPSSNVVSEFAPAYPPQRADISYGRDLINAALTGYFHAPTPNAPNATSGPGFAPEPIFSLESGFFTNNSLVVSLSTASGQIRYTLDGSAPLTNSPIYTGPLTIASNAVVKARVFQPDLLPSAVIAKTYVLLDRSVSSFSSTLPLMIINTGGRRIAQDVRPGQLRTFASLVAVDTFRGRSSPLDAPDFFGLCELEIRGQTSAGFPKKPYNLELQDAYRNDLDVPLLGLPSGSDWVLNNPYTDKPFLQNFLAFELHEQMGHYAVRRRFVEVFVNTSGSKVTYPRDYAGVYLLLEKIRAGQDRVEIARLTPYDQKEPNITGGYIFKKDKDSIGDKDFATRGGVGFSGQSIKIHEPKPREITSQQLSWLRNHLNQFERALYATNWRTASGTNHYSWYIDVDSFVDNHWIVEFSKQIDGYRLSNYMHKDRNGKIRMDPIWDWNLSFGNADYLEGGNTRGWYYSLISNSDHIWLRRLINGTTSGTGTLGDLDFNQRIADRWSVLRTNIFSASRVLARVDELASILGEAAARDFQKWPRLGIYIWPNPSFYITPKTYSGIITAMKNWIKGRYDWIDTQFVRSPEFNLPGGGRVPEGFNLSMSSGSGTIYYTLDGTDPRLAGGALSPSAQAYAGPVALSSNARAMARVKDRTRWSGPAAATFVVEIPQLAITEIMYHPAAPPLGSAHGSDDFEFLEFKNAGSSALNLAGFQITAGVAFTFPSFVVSPGQRALVVKNRAAFESRYGAGHPMVGEYTGALDNAGERLVLIGALQEPILAFSYSDQWHPITDGAGFSLVLTDETQLPPQSDQASNWRPSQLVHGSPGQLDSVPPVFPRVVVSEISTHPGTSGLDWIELQNLSPTAASIGGWFLTDDFKSPKKFRISPGTTIPAGGFLVFTENDFSTSLNARIPFGLSALGEEVYLLSGDTQTNLTGYSHGFEFGAQQAGATFGRFLSRPGQEQFVSQLSSTMSQTNSGPWIGPVLITEIMYRPPDVFTNGAFWNNSEDEYIELYNRTDRPVQLFDPTTPAHTWKLAGEVNYAFPTNITLAAGSFLLLVNFDPLLQPVQLAAFLSKFRVPDAVPILGPYEGNLGNGKGRLNLCFPVAALPNESNSDAVRYVIAEQIDYDDNPPWSPGADGFGLALHRVDPASFGNDPLNWHAAAPTPGYGYTASAAPVIVRQPAGRNALAAQTVTLNVAASSLGPLSYQWRRNGENVPGATNATLVLAAAQPNQSGEYVVVVLGQENSVASIAAQVTIEPDVDEDAIPDSWELAFGLNPYDQTDAAGDPDNDRVSNRDEYLGGTHPQVADSLMWEGISVSAQTRIWFQALADRSYTVEFSDSLAPAVWIKLTDIPGRSTNSTVMVIDPNLTTTRYYRIMGPSKKTH